MTASPEEFVEISELWFYRRMPGIPLIVRMTTLNVLNESET